MVKLRGRHEARRSACGWWALARAVAHGPGAAVSDWVWALAEIAGQAREGGLPGAGALGGAQMEHAHPAADLLRPYLDIFGLQNDRRFVT
ncbi:hypothetical protein ABZ543_27730 [Streptomyces roseifaciens]